MGSGRPSRKAGDPRHDCRGSLYSHQKDEYSGSVVSAAVGEEFRSIRQNGTAILEHTDHAFVDDPSTPQYRSQATGVGRCCPQETANTLQRPMSPTEGVVCFFTNQKAIGSNPVERATKTTIRPPFGGFSLHCDTGNIPSGGRFLGAQYTGNGQIMGFVRHKLRYPKYLRYFDRYAVADR